MLSEYLDAAMHSARYETLDTGRVYGEIQSMPGVWAEAENEDECKRELREVAEEWALMGYWQHSRLPVIGGIDPNLKMELEPVSHETAGADSKVACPGIPRTVHREEAPVHD